MPIQVQGPDGQLLEFPDGTDRDTMRAAMQKRYGGPQQQLGQPQESRQQKYERIRAELERRNGPAVDPTAGMSTMDRFWAGAGKSVHDTGRGLQQLYAMAADKVAPRQRTTSDLITGHDPSRAAEIEAQVMRDRQLDAPLMETGAGKVGNIAGQTAQIAVPIPAAAALKATSWAGRAAPYVGAAARSGLFSAAQGTAGDESRLRNGAVGAGLGVAGQGIASGTGALARGALSRADKYTQGLAQAAKDAGIRLNVPSISENPLVRTVASQMERLPFSGAGKRTAQNQQAFNRAIGKEIGVPDAKRITPEVFADAKAAAGAEFNALSARNNLALNTQHIADVRSVVDEAANLGGADLGKSIRAWANDLFSRVDANGNIPGPAYKSFDSKIGKAMASGGEKSFYLGQLRDVVRGAMDSSISAGDRAAWRAVRQRWAALKTVEPLVAKSSNGNISPASLMGRVTADSAGKTRMAAGNGGKLGELARVGQRFMKEAPNSGTADRLLVNTAIGGGLYGAQHNGWIDPSTALLLGGGLLANRAALGALGSRALTAGDGASGLAVSGLARLLSPSPYVLPAALASPAASANKRSGDTKK